LPVNMVPLERRMLALKQLLDLPQSTSKATPYSEWSTPPEVHAETDEAIIYYEKLFTPFYISNTNFYGIKK